MTDRNKYEFKPYDIIIINNDQELYFYKDVLTDKSNHFKSILSHECEETKTGKIILDDENEPIKQLLRVIHPLIQEKVDQKNVFNIFSLAYKYDFPAILSDCFTVLTKYHEQQKIDNIMTEFTFLHACLETYSVDKDLCKKIETILNNVISYFVNSDYYDIKEDTFNQIPSNIASRIIRLLYHKNKEKVAKYATMVKEVQSTLNYKTYVYPDDLTSILNKHKIMP